jgi:hypothetical protein
LRSLAELLSAYATSSVQIQRDAEEMTGLKGFTKQPTREASQPDVPGMHPERPVAPKSGA